MLNLLGYELRKLYSYRYLRIITIALLVINFIVLKYQINTAKEHMIPPDTMSDLFELYYESPEEIEESYNQRKLMEEERNKLVNDAIRNGDYDFQLDPLPNVYSDSTEYTDGTLFNTLFSEIDKISAYPKEIQKIINTAQKNLHEYEYLGISEDSYAARRQNQVIYLYENALNNVHMGLEYVHGWDYYFNYNLVNIILFLLVLCIGVVTFAYEDNVGISIIIKTTRNGRYKTSLAKIAAATLATIIVVILFIAETWILFGIEMGYSNPNNAIQIINMFSVCPYVITIGEYFAVSIFIKLLSYVTFLMIVIAISVFVNNYIIIYICGLGLLGGSYLLYNINFLNPDHFLKILNFISTATVNPLFVRYRTINIFGNPIGYLPFMLLSFTIVFILTSVITVSKYSLGTSVSPRNYRFKIFNINKIKLFSSSKSKNKFVNSLILHEMYKTAISSKLIVIIIILLSVKIFISVETYQSPQTVTDSIYQSYMTTVGGEVNNEKLLYIEQERELINKILAAYDEMKDKYSTGSITSEDYKEFLSQYSYAYTHSEALVLLEEHAKYIENLENEGDTAWFVYDSGWKALFLSPFDWTLYAAILILFTSVFSAEHRSGTSAGGFAQILRSTKNGRSKTLISKYVSTILITVILTTLWNVIDLSIIHSVYELPFPNAPIVSVQIFEFISFKISIILYAILLYSVRLIAAILLSVIICSLSELLRKRLLIMTLTVLLTLFPALLNSLGIKLFSKMDYLSFARGTPILLQNYTIFAYTVGCIVVCTIMVFCAKRKWNR